MLIVFCDSVLGVVFGARGSFQDGLVHVNRGAGRFENRDLERPERP